MLALLTSPVAAEAAPAPRILRTAEVGRRLGLCPRSVRNLAKQGTLPPFRLPGRVRAVGYREGDVIALIEGRGGSAVDVAGIARPRRATVPEARA